MSVDIDRHSIDAVQNTTFLGIYIDSKLKFYIDSKLNWKKHIAYISGKVSRGIGNNIESKGNAK